SGLIWVANFAGGLLLYNPLSHGLHLLSASRPKLSFGDVYTVESASGNRLWVGGKRGSISVLDPNTAQVTRARASNGSLVFNLFSDLDALWVGTGRGLCRLPAARSVAECPAGPAAIGMSSVYAMLHANGSFWVGTRSGLIRDGAPFGGINDMVRTLYVDRERI